MKLRLFFLLGLSAIFLTSCASFPFLSGATPTATEAAPTSLPTPQVTPTPGVVRSLTICAGSEPAELYLYNNLTYIKRVILSAIYDGPVDVIDYDYQPVILTKLPSLADDDAIIEPVQVEEGEQVIDNSGALAILQPGVVIRQTGCRSSDCAVTYEGGAIQMDHLRVVFHILPGVQWTDGAPVTADDSVFSYKISVNAETLYGYNGLVSGSVQSVIGTADYVALDDLTTQWTGLPGFLDPNYQVNFFIPLPEHQLSNYTIAQLSEANEVLYAPLGWGAYQVTAWDTGIQMTLETNPHYFRAAQGLPYFNKLVIRFVGQDSEANLTAFQEGQCDILLQDASPETPTTALLGMLNSGEASIYINPAATLGASSQPVFEQLTFDLSPVDSDLPALFADVQMRRAVAACVDRSALTDAIYAGLVPPLDLALPFDHPLMNGADLSYAYDQGQGISLLEELGWIDTDGDGIREAHGVSGIEDGTLLSYALTTTDSARRAQVGALIADQLKSCGMEVSLVQDKARTLFAQNTEATLIGRHFEMAELSTPMSVEALCALAMTEEVPSDANGWSGSNISGYSNRALDDACASVEGTLPGTQEYIVSRQTALRLFSADLPVFPLFYNAYFTLARPDLVGILTGFGQSSELQNVESFGQEP